MHSSSVRTADESRATLAADSSGVECSRRWVDLAGHPSPFWSGIEVPCSVVGEGEGASSEMEAARAGGEVGSSSFLGVEAPDGGRKP